MSRKSIFSDSLDELFELAKSTGQQAARTAKSLTLGTAKKALEQITGQSSTSTEPNKGIEKLTNERKQINHTPLNFEELGEKYQEQDNKEMAKVRRLWHFFNLEKETERKAIEQRKREEDERKRKKEIEEQERRKREQAQHQEAVPIPKGKERRSIFAPKRAVKRAQAETRVGSGKQ